VNINMSAYPNPPKEPYCDLPECLSCGHVDSDLEQCAGRGCDALLHRRCGDRCEACGKVVCQLCVDHWEEYTCCPECMQEMRDFDESLIFEEMTLA
jgi:hypothetical protein